jgi:hypothetical protein
VPTAARKPLSIGFQEIAADKIRWADLPAEVPAEAEGAAAVDAAAEDTEPES